MGCAESRAQMGTEEKAITKGEDSLGWGKFESTKAITAFEHRGSKDTLSSNQFKAALGDFDAAFDWIGSPDSELYKVFQNFKEGRNFDGKKLQLLAILIGKGEAKEKAQFLFDAFDENADEELTKLELGKAFEGLADIAIKYLVDLGVGKPEEGKLDEGKIQSYKKKLETQQPEKVEKILNDIFGENEKVGRGEFQSKMMTKGFKELVTSYGLRAHICGPLEAAKDESLSANTGEQTPAETAS